MAGNIKVGSAGSSGTTTLQSTESSDHTISLPDSAGTVMLTPLLAGTTSVAPYSFTAGTNLTSSTAGAMEYDGTCFYSSPVAGARGINMSTMFAVVGSGGFALSTASGVQTAFPTGGRIWTLAGSTSYWFEGLYFIQEATNAVTTALAFATGSGASVTSILYTAIAQNAAANTTGTSVNVTIVNQISSTIVTASAASNVWIRFEGVIRMNAAGTITPQINFSGTAAGTPTMLANSYIRFSPLGTNVVAAVGNVT